MSKQCKLTSFFQKGITKDNTTQDNIPSSSPNPELGVLSELHEPDDTINEQEGKSPT